MVVKEEDSWPWDYKDIAVTGNEWQVLDRIMKWGQETKS